MMLLEQVVVGLKRRRLYDEKISLRCLAFDGNPSNTLSLQSQSIMADIFALIHSCLHYPHDSSNGQAGRQKLLAQAPETHE